MKHVDNNTSSVGREVDRHTQINANGTVIHFVRHFVLSERFVVEREEGCRGEEEERGVSRKEILPL